MEAFLETLQTERVWGQVLIERDEAAFRLRHVDDRSKGLKNLRTVPILELRSMAMYDAAGQFRPLRVAPDLVKEWVCYCRTPEELWRAVQAIYPGSIPDWYATQIGAPPVTNYREFSNRQSGMYRITQLLTDEQATQVIRACCHPRFCLKRRFWTVERLISDRAEEKSAVPCLEPCAVLLELARKAARIEQEEKARVQLSPSELQTLVSAAKTLLESGATEERVGNIGSSTNPRRLQLVLEKYGAAVNDAQDREEERL